MENGILFLGDSFTWGEGLELYCDTPKWIAEREKDNNSWLVLSEKQDEDGIKFREENRFPALVAKHFNKTAFVNDTNGGSLAGSIATAHKFLFNPDVYIDTIVLQFSNFQRDPLHVTFSCICEFCMTTTFARLFENADELLEKIIKRTNLDSKEKLILLELEKLIGKNWFDNDNFIDLFIQARKKWYVDILFNFYNLHLAPWESDGKRKIYFIDSWEEESSDAIFDDYLHQHYPHFKYQTNMIPLVGKDNNSYLRWKSWENTFEYRNIAHEFKNTDNGHPTLEQHQYLAKSVIKFLEEKHDE